MKYKCLTGSKSGDIGERVTAMLEAGWSPHGPTVYCPASDDTGECFMQAVVLHDPEPVAGDARPVIDYEVLFGEDVGELAANVRKFVADGWEPVGGVVFNPPTDELHVGFSQAVVRRRA